MNVPLIATEIAAAIEDEVILRSSIMIEYLSTADRLKEWEDILQCANHSEQEFIERYELKADTIVFETEQSYGWYFELRGNPKVVALRSTLGNALAREATLICSHTCPAKEVILYLNKGK